MASMLLARTGAVSPSPSDGMMSDVALGSTERQCQPRTVRLPPRRGGKSALGGLAQRINPPYPFRDLVPTGERLAHQFSLRENCLSRGLIRHSAVALRAWPSGTIPLPPDSP